MLPSNLLSAQSKFLLNCNRLNLIRIDRSPRFRGIANEWESLTKERRFQYRVTHNRLAAWTWRVWLNRVFACIRFSSREILEARSSVSSRFSRENGYARSDTLILALYFCVYIATAKLGELVLENPTEGEHMLQFVRLSLVVWKNG